MNGIPGQAIDRHRTPILEPTSERRFHPRAAAERSRGDASLRVKGRVVYSFTCARPRLSTVGQPRR
jgi:hypothetical protein